MLTDDFEGASLKGFLMLMSSLRPCEMTNRNKNNKTGFDNLGLHYIINTIYWGATFYNMLYQILLTVGMFKSHFGFVKL